MKKTVVFFVLAMLVFGSCSNKQKIMGSWTDTEKRIWVFSPNGKLTYKSHYMGDVDYQYSIIGTKLSLEINGSAQIYNISLSADGNTLILTDGIEFSGWSVAGPGWSKNQLTKLSSKSTNKVDKSLNGKWVGEDDIITFNNGQFEVSSEEGEIFETFAYTTSNGKLNFIDPYDDDDFFSINYSIKGKTLSLEKDGETREYTRK